MAHILVINDIHRRLDNHEAVLWRCISKATCRRVHGICADTRYTRALKKHVDIITQQDVTRDSVDAVVSCILQYGCADFGTVDMNTLRDKMCVFETIVRPENGRTNAT